AVLPDFIRKAPRTLGGSRVRWEAHRDRSFLSAQLTSSDGGSILVYGADEPAASVRRLIERVIHVPGLRATTERAYTKSSVAYMYPGRFDRYLASILFDW